MTRNATGLSNLAKGLGGAVVLALGCSPAFAQEDDQVVKDREPNAMDIAATPITDLNLRKDPIPETLLDAVTAPYASERMAQCEDIQREVLRLDAVLGPDLDIDTEDRDDITVGKVAQSAVGSLIPFRGIIRELTGAADHQRDFQEAIFAGAVRRGYLKGLGEARGCSYPARPASTRFSMTDSPTVDGDVDRSFNEVPRIEPRMGNVTFVSEPVVQGD